MSSYMAWQQARNIEDVYDEHPDDNIEDEWKQAPKLAGRVQTCHEYEPGAGNTSLLWYWMKGHEKPEDFVAAVDWDYEEKFQVSDVQHGYCRNVPTGYDSDMVMLLARDGTSQRGAYPITFIDVDRVAVNRAAQRFQDR